MKDIVALLFLYSLVGPQELLPTGETARVSGQYLLVEWPKYDHMFRHKLLERPGLYTACGSFLYKFIPEKGPELVVFAYVEKDKNPTPVYQDARGGKVRIRVDPSGSARLRMYETNGEKGYALGLPAPEYETVKRCLIKPKDDSKI